MSGKLERPKSLTELAKDAIRARIVDGVLKLGETISENALAQELGISKTPVRDAMQQLRSEGLVEILPSRGTVVFSISAEEVRQLSRYRDVLETAALRLCIDREPERLADTLAVLIDEMAAARERDDLPAYRRLDATFHQTIFDAAGNSYLQGAYEKVANRIQALRTRMLIDPQHIEDSHREHIEMVALLRARRLDDLVDAMARHVANTMRSFLAVMGSDNRPQPGLS